MKKYEEITLDTISNEIAKLYRMTNEIIDFSHQLAIGDPTADDFEKLEKLKINHKNQKSKIYDMKKVLVEKGDLVEN